jgi:hypothetical protein
MKHSTQGIYIPVGAPCEAISKSSIYERTKLGDSVYKTYTYQDKFLTFLSSKELGIGGIINVFIGERHVFELRLPNNEFITDVKTYDNLLFVCFSNETCGKISIYNMSDNKLLHEIKNNKPWFAKKILIDYNLIHTLHLESDSINLQSYSYKFNYKNSSLSFETYLKKEKLLNLKINSNEYTLAANSFSYFVGLPHEKQGKLLVLDKNFDLLQILIPRDLLILYSEFNDVKNSAYGATCDANNLFLVVRAPNTYSCADKNGKECYRGAVYIYKFNNEQNTYNYFFKITNPLVEVLYETDPLFSLGLKLKNDYLFISNPVAEDHKGIVYKYKLNDKFNGVITDSFPFDQPEEIRIEDKTFSGTGVDLSINNENLICFNGFELIKDNVLVPSVVIRENK